MAVAVGAPPWLPPKVVGVVAGGDRRQASVAAGVQAFADAPDDRVLLVHDGARPLVSGRTIAEVVAATRDHGAAIPVLPVAETLKRLDGDVVARDGRSDRRSPPRRPRRA